MLAVLAIPLWLAGDRLGVIVALRIPASDLALAFVPTAAALVLEAWRSGWRAPLALLARAADIRAIGRGRWLAATLMLAPLLYLATWAIMALAGGQGAPTLSATRLALLFALFLVLAAGEEVGWTGYALDPLQRRWGALGASLILAVPWWLGHLPSMQAVGATAADIAWWALAAPALRILFTWLYNGTGGALASAVIFHALLNLSRIATYPAAGPHYDPRYQAVGSAVAALAAALVVLRVPSLLRRPQ
ncbi:CPBP family intramembrane glutamic endopeptidase [Phenylobacterium sp.]|uniref:CPBP family intramembrane glutamic endopeptidase n=1 Tax=Phenylobacterium sp. TaxID=1871053 RepID=UPI0025E94B45|nr:CPBP family intramembrane glutamic endopeptidase [Phenylobacterium sp.]